MRFFLRRRESSEKVPANSSQFAVTSWQWAVKTSKPAKGRIRLGGQYICQRADPPGQTVNSKQ